MPFLQPLATSEASSTFSEVTKNPSLPNKLNKSLKFRATRDWAVSWIEAYQRRILTENIILNREGQHRQTKLKIKKQASKQIVSTLKEKNKLILPKYD